MPFGGQVTGPGPPGVEGFLKVSVQVLATKTAVVQDDDVTCARVDQLPLFPYNRGWSSTL